MDLDNNAVWIGYTDTQHEGDWRLLSGERLDRSDENFLNWLSWLPNGGTYENCAHLMLHQSILIMNDNLCSLNVWEYPRGKKYKFYGLCEIC